MQQNLASSPLQFADDYFGSRTLSDDTINNNSDDSEVCFSTQQRVRKTPSIMSLSTLNIKNKGVIFNDLRTVPTSSMTLENAKSEPPALENGDSQSFIQTDDAASRSFATSLDYVNSPMDSSFDNTDVIETDRLPTGFPHTFDFQLEFPDEDSDPDFFFTRRRHFFIISSAGKPIYSMHGSYDLFVVYSGIIQTIVSFFEISSTPENIRIVESFDKTTGDPIKLVFLNRSPIILMSIVKNDYSDVLEYEQQLDFLYSFLLSALSKPYIDKIYNKYANFDLRNLLGNTDIATIDSICEDLSNGLNVSQVMGGLSCLRMHDSVRSKLENKMIKIRTPELLYGLIIGPNEKLISIIRPKKHTLHTSDLMILFEMIYNTNIFKTKNDDDDTMKFVTSETFWVPICLPKFNSSGHLYTLLQFHQLHDDRLFKLHGVKKPELNLADDDTKVGIVLMSPYKDAFNPMRKISNAIAKEVLFDTKLYKDIWGSMTGNGRIFTEKIISTTAPENSSIITSTTTTTKRRSTLSSLVNSFVPSMNVSSEIPSILDGEVMHFTVNNKRLVQYIFPESSKFNIHDKKIRQNLLHIYKYIKRKLQHTSSDMYLEGIHNDDINNNFQNCLVYDTWVSRTSEERLVTFGYKSGEYEVQIIAKGTMVDENKLIDATMQILRWCHRQKRRIFIN